MSSPDAGCTAAGNTGTFLHMFQHSTLPATHAVYRVERHLVENFLFFFIIFLNLSVTMSNKVWQRKYDRPSVVIETDSSTVKKNAADPR